ncbi:MAG: methyltransferase domain-containing protein [Hydrogenothermaceae bacterium]|nr:methyltransferase domain-containing protein [Hydrogenothermaceae bacterium]
MSNLKNLYRLSFSKACKSYEEDAVIQKESAKIISDIAKDYSGLGLDCGSGTCFIKDYLPTKDIISVDISKSMVDICKKKGYKAVVGDIENLPFKDEIFDYCLSNFSLHWTDLNISFQEIDRVLKNGGYILFSIPVVGSLKAIEDILGKTFFEFPTEEEVIEKAKEYFKIRELFKKEFKLMFEDGMSLLKHLHRTGTAVNPKDLSMGEKLQIVKSFSEYKSPTILNFNLLFIEAQKS